MYPLIQMSTKIKAAPSWNWTRIFM